MDTVDSFCVRVHSAFVRVYHLAAPDSPLRDAERGLGRDRFLVIASTSLAKHVNRCVIVEARDRLAELARLGERATTIMLVARIVADAIDEIVVTARFVREAEKHAA
jgi:hypothetical protein